MATPSLLRLARKKFPPGKILINGKWRDAMDGATMTTTDPTTEEIITQVAKAFPADADEAVEAASKAFEEGPWPRMHLEKRAKLLFRIADLLDERAKEFAKDVGLRARARRRSTGKLHTTQNHPG